MSAIHTRYGCKYTEHSILTENGVVPVLSTDGMRKGVYYYILLSYKDGIPGRILRVMPK